MADCTTAVRSILVCLLLSATLSANAKSKFDYDGDGKSDIWSKNADNGTWYIDYASNVFGGWDVVAKGSRGGSGAVPVPADYDGDGKADLSVKDADGTWYIDYAKDGFGGWEVVVTPKAITLQLNRLCCDKTTEDGADEIYFIVTGKNTSSGETFSSRFPGEGQHSDMNDGNQPNDNKNGDSHCITVRTLHGINISPGQSWDVNILIMEEDGGTTKTTQQVAALMLSNSGNGYAEAAGAVLDLLTKAGQIIKDTDDYIGSFAMHASSDSSGQVSTSFTPSNNSRITIQSVKDHVVEFRFGGSGSDYIGEFQLVLR